jgi:hypothetical protein
VLSSREHERDADALVLVTTPTACASAVAPHGGRLAETDLDEDGIAALRKDLRHLDWWRRGPGLGDVASSTTACGSRGRAAQ